MLINSRYAAAWAKLMYMMLYEPVYTNTYNYNGAAGGIWLCTGVVPTDAEVAALVDASSAKITSNVTVKYAASALALADANAQPPVFNLTLPATKSVAATKVGTITWAAIFTGGSTTNATPTYPVFAAVADTSATGGGGCVQVDTTTVSTVGQLITLTGFSFKPWR